MARPSENPPEWGTAETNDTEPGSGQKASGWTIGQIAISGFQNWWQRVTYEWVSWFKGVFDGTEGDWRLVNSRTNANDAIFEISQGPEAHAAGNAWKQLFSANTGSGRTLRLFSGKIGQSAGFIATLNVTWNPATQLWSLETSGADAAALVLDWGGNGIVSWTKPNGSSSWGPLAWDLGPVRANDLITAGGAVVNGTLTATDIAVTDDLTVTNDVVINGTLDVDDLVTVTNDVSLQNLGATGNVTLAGELFYNAPKTRFRAYSANAFQSPSAATRDFTTGTITGDAGGARHHVLHLEAPAQSTLWEVVVHYDASGASQVIANIERLDISTGTVSNLRASGGLNSSSTGSNQSMAVTCDQNNIITSVSPRTYQVRITLAASTGAVLRGVEVEYRMDRPKVF